MSNPRSQSAVKLWRAPDVMDAVMLKGHYIGHRYPPHAHDTHCLAVVTSGAMIVEVRGQRRICRRGDIIVIDADTVHSGRATGQGRWKLRTAHVHPAALAAYSERLGIPRRERFALVSPFICDRGLSGQLYGLSWCSEVDEDGFKRSEALANLIISLLAQHRARSGDLPVVRREPALVRAVKSRLTRDLHSRLTLPLLASEFGVSPFVLLRAFVREAGLSPHAFQQQERVRHALPLLRAGRPIAEVGAEIGFFDQSHFTRVFKQQTGVTPKIYQAAFF